MHGEQAQAALMYDAVFVLVEALTKILRKKPDQFRSYTLRRSGTVPVMGNLTLGLATGTALTSPAAAAAAAPRVLDCNTSKGWVNPWEHGDRISRYLRKVSRVVCFDFDVLSSVFIYFSFSVSRDYGAAGLVPALGVRWFPADGQGLGWWRYLTLEFS